MTESASPEAPAISVVVPIYNVEPYLEECLESIAAQSVTDLEVICIDDGSTDASGEIADAFAATDPRFRVVHQANGGLGAARNAGAALARGDFLAFVDSDDLLPPDAYALLHSSLRASGSDIAVGDIRRLTSLGLRPSPTFSPIYTPSRRATHVTRDHALLRDRIAPNKLYRRSFWIGHVLTFPVGVLYEDIAVTIRAHALARAVDVIDAVVYWWRIRSGSDRSITQRRLELPALRDRVAAVTSASRFLGDQGMDAEKRAYDQLSLTDDLRLFARLLDRADPTFVATFLDEARAFLAQAHPEALDDAPAIERLRWALIRDGSAEEVMEIARFVRTQAKDRPAIRRGRNRVEGDLPFRRGRRPRLPRKLFRYDQELELQTRVTGFEVSRERIDIHGWAHLRHVEVPVEDRDRVRMWLVREGAADDDRLELSVEPRRCPEATARGVPDLYDLSGAGFRASVATSELADRWRSGVDRWNVEVEVRGGGVMRSGPLAGPDPGAARRPSVVDIGKLRVGPRVDDDVISVVVSARPIVVTSADVDDAALRLQVTSRRQLTHLRLRRTGVEDLQVPFAELGEDRFEVSLAAQELAPERVDGTVEGRPTTRAYALHAIDATGKPGRLQAADDLDQPVVAHGKLEMTLDITRYGYTALALRPASVWLDEVTTYEFEPRAVVTDGVLSPEAAGRPGFRLGGRFLGGDLEMLRFELAPRDRLDPRPASVVITGSHRVEVTIPALSRPAGEPPSIADPAPLAGGIWYLTAWLEQPDGDRREVEVRTRRSLIAALPRTLQLGGKRLDLDDRSWQLPAVNVTDDLTVAERGRFNQRRLWITASAGSRRKLDTTIVFAVSAGRSVGGDARAVYDELRRRDPAVPVSWTVDDQQVAPPPGATGLRRGGREWHEALAHSAWIVTDAPLPRSFERAPRQNVIRLWSGVPVRPVGAEAPGVVGAERPQDVKRAWSHVVSPGSDASAVLRRAFGLDAEVLEVGLPRHDVLHDPVEAVARGTALRFRLGLHDDAPVVLHLPTWMDGERHPGGGLRLTTDLDLSALRASAGADAWLLGRAHPDVVDAVAAARAEPQILDVSRFPDVVALMLAADVVIAHPSSVVLEAIRCGASVVVHDPVGAGIATELGEPYRNLVGASVPWPVACTPDELHEAVRAIVADRTKRRGVARIAAVEAASRPGAERTHGEVTTGRAAAAVVDLLLS